MRRQWAFTVAILVCGLAGCTLENVPERGERCPDPNDTTESPLQYIIKDTNADGNKCTSVDECKCDSPEACPEYAENFELSICPKEIATCHRDLDNNYYCMNCSGNLVACNGKCIDSNNDKQFCGAKGNCYDNSPNSENYKGKVCDEDSETCENGECVLKCPKDHTICNGRCIDPKTNGQYCGAKGSCNENDDKSSNYSGQRCDIDEKCSDGKCVKAACTGIICNGECTYPDTDRRHCGARGYCDDSNESSADYMGALCNAYSECKNGQCECIDKSAKCDGECIEPLTDSRFCGAKGACNVEEDPENDNYRGVACGEDQFCNVGTCTTNQCKDDMVPCLINGEGNQCKDIKNDVEHCGGCNMKCSDLAVSGKIVAGCAEGKCILECNTDENYVNCGTEESPICLQLNTVDNCGACGNQCNPGEVCNEGNCEFKSISCKSDQCLDTQTNNCVNYSDKCGGECVNCNLIENIASDGANCSMQGECFVIRCKDNYHISEDGKSCVENSDTECANPASSTIEDCTNMSGGAGTCVSGVCVKNSCDGNVCFNSNGTCSNSVTGCGAACLNCNSTSVIPNVVSGECDNGVCNAKTCQDNSHLDGSGGCEQNTNANCGAHGTKCDASVIPGGTAFDCSDGTCKATACESGYHKYSNGCEKNTNTNCGGHELKCDATAKPGGTAFDCNDGTCKATACGNGYHKYNNGCEQNTNTNCGGHEVKCNASAKPGGSAFDCSDGTCKATACGNGYHKYNDECEQNTDTNCGSHGTNCANMTGGTYYCSNTRCVADSCKSSYHLWNGTCEKNDNTNCGSHNTSCKSGTVCKAYSGSYKCLVQTCSQSTNNMICENGSSICRIPAGGSSYSCIPITESNKNCFQSATGTIVNCTYYHDNGLTTNTGKCVYDPSKADPRGKGWKPSGWTCECQSASQAFDYSTSVTWYVCQ